MIFKELKKITLNLITIATAFSLASCENLIYDQEEDCNVHHYLTFVYDMNLKWADAFASEVHSVNLYVFDKEGIFVEEYSDNGSALAQPGYKMELNLAPGNYTLVAWCGLNNALGQGESFTVTTPERGKTTLQDLMCALNVKASEEYQTYSDTQLKFLYHGNMEVSITDPQDGSDFYYTMYLTKDTNHVRIILQELSGTNVEESDYVITIDCEDAEMAYDNTIVGSTLVNYLPWEQISDEMVLGDENSEGGLKYNMGLIADLSTARLLAAESDQTFLTIRRSGSDGEIVARVPLIDYALLTKRYYEEAYGHTLDNQEFLDREDEYQLTFFLYQGSWISSYIYINSWRIVLHEYGAGKD